MIHKAVFLDRDGVINSDEGHYYVFKKADFKLNPEIVESLKLLSDNGFALVIITNQGGVAKGEYSLEDVSKLHSHLKKELAKHDVEIDGIYVCPHHESIAPCECRKPSPFMIKLAMDELDINPNISFLIGDSDRDIEAGNFAGLKECFKVQKNCSILPVCKKIVEIDASTR